MLNMTASKTIWPDEYIIDILHCLIGNQKRLSILLLLSTENILALWNNAISCTVAATGNFIVLVMFPLPLPVARIVPYISLYLHPSDSQSLGNQKDYEMKPWHERALKRGRSPLPEGPGQRPWLPLEIPERPSITREVSGAPQGPNHAEDAVPTPVPDEANVNPGTLRAIFKLLID